MKNKIEKMSFKSLLSGNHQSKKETNVEQKMAFGKLIAEGRYMVEKKTNDLPANAYSTYSKKSSGNFKVNMTDVHKNPAK